LLITFTVGRAFGSGKLRADDFVLAGERHGERGVIGRLGRFPCSADANFASPKSSSLMPALVTRIFAGFRSRCVMPFLCAASRASQICAAYLVLDR
jgi:hypothetical protein